MDASDAQPLTLGTAGHIDHGKTVLVEALTGVNTDRLPEERLRGISIELGFAPLELPSGRVLSVVDVPGHERFVRTMVAGSTGVDLFLLVIAADDGVMPQTREHLAVLGALEVPVGIVAVTKADLVDAEGLELAIEEVRDFLAGGPYARTPIVAVSARARRGLGELAGALDDAASVASAASVSSVSSGSSEADGPARLHVDRSFSLKGIGTVVTGTLWSGTLREGDEVRIEPSRRTARVRSIEVHGSARPIAAAGQRVALNLAGVDRREVERGDVVCSSSTELRATYLVDVAVDLIPEARPLRRGSRVHVHHGTRESPARISPVESDVLEPGARAYAQLRLERPLVPAPGDRFVLRQVAPPDTIGGGVVLDPAPRKHGAGKEHATRLELLESGDSLGRLLAELEGAPSGIAEGDADLALLERLCSSGQAFRIGGEARYFSPARLERARAGVLRALRELGTGRPLSRGALADAAGVSDLAARAVLEDLVGSGEVVVRGPGFLSAQDAAEDDPRLERLAGRLAAGGLEPSGSQALSAELRLPQEEIRDLLERAALAGRVVKVRAGVYYHPDALSEARRRVALLCDRDGAVTIATLRDDLGTSRKYAQALLEHFDAERVTRRVGDAHVLRRAAEAGATPEAGSGPDASGAPLE